MSALDRYHENVTNALRKDGWTITHNPLRLTLDSRTLVIDLGAERLIAAEKTSERLLSKLKPLVGPLRLLIYSRLLGNT